MLPHTAPHTAYRHDRGGTVGEGRGRGGPAPSFEDRVAEELDKAKSLLDKAFVFHRHGIEVLPEHLFSSLGFEVPELLDGKKRLNESKDRLDNVDLRQGSRGVGPATQCLLRIRHAADFSSRTWERHAGLVNRAGSVVWTLRDKLAPELCTIAWAKMYETIVSMNLLPSSLLDDKASESGDPFKASPDARARADRHGVEQVALASRACRRCPASICVRPLVPSSRQPTTTSATSGPSGGGPGSATASTRTSKGTTPGP